MSVLFSPFSLKDLRLRNRIVMPPMCMYSSDDGGKAKEWHFCHYQTRAIGGAGLIMVEATSVDPAGRISGQDLGIWDDDHIPGLRKIADLCRSRGAAVGIQLAHAGRKSTVLHTPIHSPGNERFSPDYRVPEPMTLEEITRTVKAFGAAASRAREAGFDLVEIHAAHGYLLNQFLSPLVNKRTDAYGGSPENRARIVAEVVEEVRRAWPHDRPLQIRVSAEEFTAGGNDPRRTAELVNLVKAGGIDIVHVSSGGVTADPVKAYPGYQIPFAEIVRSVTGLPVIAGGLVTDPERAEEIVALGKGDLVFLGRELLRDPYWPLHAARRLGAEITWPFQYERAKI